MMTALTEQLRARAACIRATPFQHIGEKDAREFADLFDKAAQEIERLTAQRNVMDDPDF
jgi:hypothetical protein